MSIVTDRGPTENDIVIATNGSKRRETEGTQRYLDHVKEHYEEYIQHNKFSKEKKKIVQKILTTSLKKGRFMKEVEGVTGQWFVLSEEEAKERVKQRFCDETRARKKKKEEAETKRVAAQAQKSVQKAATGAKATQKAKVTKKVTSKINKTNRSRKIVKDAKVSKAAKVATGINADPPASKGGATIVRHDAVTTPTSGTDTCKSFEPIFSPKCVAATCKTIHNPPIFEHEEDVAPTSNERLKMKDGMDDVANNDLLEFLDNYESFGPIIDLASFSLVTSVLEEDVTPNERLATEGGLDDMTVDELLILGDLFEDW